MKKKAAVKSKVEKARKEEIVHGKEHEEKEEGSQGDVLTPKVNEKPEPEPERFKEKPEASMEVRISESRKALDQPLAPGQGYFQTPDGEILVGEADKGRIWARTMNNGKGGWANPKR